MICKDMTESCERDLYKNHGPFAFILNHIYFALNGGPEVLSCELEENLHKFN